MTWAQTDDPELDDALRELGKQRFLFHSFGDSDALAAVHDWGGCADVLIFHSEFAVTAYRTPTGELLDPFAPSHILWLYASTAADTLRAVLALPSPAAPDAPTNLQPAPEGIGLSAQWRAERRVRVGMRPLG